MSASLVKDSHCDTVKCKKALVLPVTTTVGACQDKGSIIYDSSTEVNGKYGTVTYSDGTEWIPLITGSGNNLIAGDGIDITSNGSQVTISSPIAAAPVVLVSADPSLPNGAVLTGTPNQVIVTPGAGTETLSTPQDLAPTSNVAFNSVVFPNTGGGLPAPLDYYEKVNLSLPVTGFTAPQNMDVSVTKIGNMAVMTWNGVFGTTTGVPLPVTITLPPRFAPLIAGSGAYIAIQSPSQRVASIVTVAQFSLGIVSFWFGADNFPINTSVQIASGSISWLCV